MTKKAIKTIQHKQVRSKFRYIHIKKEITEYPTDK